MIDQPEIGLLAFAVRRAADGPEWLMQCKVEPGNTHGAQLAPTVQATKSNLDRAHDGDPTPLTTLVTAPGRTLLANGAWSEQGSRFIGKRNENRTVLVTDVPEFGQVYRWVSAPVVRSLLRTDYALNTDARSVIATGPWELLATGDATFRGDLHASYNAPDRGIGHALELLGRARKHRPRAERIPVADVRGVVLDRQSPTPLRHAHFNVHQVVTDAKTREVPHWDQPLVASHGVGRIALLLFPDERGILRARLTLDDSPGLTHGPEWCASVVDIPGAATTELPVAQPLAEVWTSEEGGRFDNSQNHVLVAVTERPPAPRVDTPHIDLTLAALERLVRTPMTVTNELRTAIALLLSLA